MTTPFSVLISRSGLLQSGHGHIAAAIVEAKMNLSFENAFVRGILCNALVCIAVWMILAGRTIPSKLAGLIFPISAFIAIGFEHSIANFYLLPAGILAGAAGSLGAAVSAASQREDDAIDLAGNPKGRKAVNSLLNDGLVEEVPAGDTLPVSRLLKLWEQTVYLMNSSKSSRQVSPQIRVRDDTAPRRCGGRPIALRSTARRSTEGRACKQRNGSRSNCDSLL
jgi:hypothetical protein